MDEEKNTVLNEFRTRLEDASGYSQVWTVVKDTAEFSTGRRRRSMMLFLDDLPIHLGAYHPLGTNNIVLNRTLVQIVEATGKSKRVVNALIYNLLLHEYLHALGRLSEREVRDKVYNITRECFGEKYITTLIARRSPWAILKDVRLDSLGLPRRVMEIVKDFEKSDRYIV